MNRSVEQLKEDAEAFAKAQDVMASRTSEDMAYWHHFSVAQLIRELAAALPCNAGSPE